MPGSVFQWIYCMDIPDLVLLAAAASAVFAWGYRRYHEQRWCRPVVVLLLAVSMAAIFALTLVRGGERTAWEPSLTPFASYVEVWNGGNPELLRSNFMNVLLFYPAGLLTVVLLPKKWHPVLWILSVVIVFALMSAAIEYAQYAFVLGQPEVDDVIHNTLGALIGGVCGSLIGAYKKRNL